MKRSFLHILIVLLIASELQANAKVHKLEQQLAWSVDEDCTVDKVVVARSLLRIDPENIKAIEFICNSYTIDHKDSIRGFLDRLIVTYPGNKNLYILKANYLAYQLPELSEKQLVRREIMYLRKAYRLDSADSQINYLLALAYYQDFIRPYEHKEFGIGLSETAGNRLQAKGIRPSYLPNSGRWALWHFQKVAKYGADSMKLIVYFPMQQLRYLLLGQKPDTLHYPGSLVSKYDYPLWDFAGLTPGWYRDRTTNYPALIEWVAEANYRQSRFLRSIGEPSLSRIKLKKGDETIRFSWFRSFRSDVFVRLDKRGDDYRLYWRETGWSVLQKKDSIRTGWREITQRDFTNFIGWLRKTNSDKLTAYHYVPMFDGDNLVLETVGATGLKVYESNSPSADLRKVCYLLVSMTDIDLFSKQEREVNRQEIQRMHEGTTEYPIIVYALAGLVLIVVVLMLVYAMGIYVGKRKRCSVRQLFAGLI